MHVALQIALKAIQREPKFQVEENKKPLTSSSSKKRKHEKGGDLCMMPELRQTADSSKGTKAGDGVATTVSQAHDDKFKDVCIEDIIILEICAGSARLTKAARGQGFRRLVPDKWGNILQSGVQYISSIPDLHFQYIMVLTASQ